MQPPWDEEQMNVARQIVMQRFATNSVAGHLAQSSMVARNETTFQSDRFDFATNLVADRETFGLYEPFALCKLTRAQVDEFGSADAESGMHKKAVTTLNRAATRLARWHDVLFFRGSSVPAAMKPADVVMPPVNPAPRSLYEAAENAEKALTTKPIEVTAPANEGVVAAVYSAVLALEARGYYSAYHLILGEELWCEIHRPSKDSMVLPRQQIEPTLIGGSVHRTTTLPEKEGLLASLDGPTFDCVQAGDGAQQPRFEFLRIEAAKADEEELFVFRVVERFAPRVREDRAIVRLIIV